MSGFKVKWPLRILARAQRIPGGKKLIEICQRDETITAMQACIRVGAKPVTALTAPLLKEVPEAEARGHSLKQLAGEATAHLCEAILGATRLHGSRVIVGNALFSSGTGFREAGNLPPPVALEEGADYFQLVRGFIAALPDTQLVALANLVAAEQEQRKVS